MHKWNSLNVPRKRDAMRFHRLSFLIACIGSISIVSCEALSTARVKRLRERRSRGVAMCAPVEVGAGGLGLLVSNGLLKGHEARARKAVGEACLAALEQWSDGHGARSTGQG